MPATTPNSGGPLTLLQAEMVTFCVVVPVVVVATCVAGAVVVVLAVMGTCVALPVVGIGVDVIVVTVVAVDAIVVTVVGVDVIIVRPVGVAVVVVMVITGGTQLSKMMEDVSEPHSAKEQHCALRSI